MRARLDRWLDFLRTGFWFVPLVMLVLAAALAVVLLLVDKRFDPGIRSSFSWAYSGGPEGARSLLSTIAGSMITAASVTFSLASVALSIASQQYGSRVLRNFMRDRITQVLLGIFVSTFIYSVLVVRAIRGSDYSGGFVPAISVTGAIVLSVISLVMLIFFVHHISASIQASRIVNVVSRDLQSEIVKLYPLHTGDALQDHRELEQMRNHTRMPIALQSGGYLQGIDLDSLLKFATEKEIVIELLIKPGDHHVAGDEVATVWGSGELAGDGLEAVVRAFALGRERTPGQDIRFQFQQMTDVVVRSLSPGINDPFTAVNGIDELASGISLLARRPRIAEGRQDEAGKLRLIVPWPDVSEVLEQTVGHIAVYGAKDRFVMSALRRVLKTVEPHLMSEKEQRMIRYLRFDLDKREASAADS